MINKAQRFRDRQTRKYDHGEKQFEAVYEGIIAQTIKYLDPNDTVLDFGCATGTKTLYLASAVKHIHGLDISAEMV
jgi:predicted TPR repeat methyltransferase